MSCTREQVMTSDLASEIEQYSDPPRDLTMGRRGMAASVNQLVSQTATDVLRRGGDAVDAAIASAAMLGGIPEDGLLTTTGPGTLACWDHASARYGTLPLAELLDPAIS